MFICAFVLGQRFTVSFLFLKQSVPQTNCKLRVWAIPNILSRAQILWFNGYIEIASSRQNDSGIDSVLSDLFPTLF